MKFKRFLASLLALSMLVICCACGKPAATSTTTGGDLPSKVIVPMVTEEEIKVSLEELANAVKINVKNPATETQEIPLLIILVNFDANGNGVDDFDENEPEYAKSMGEQWSGTDLAEHYELYFGDGYSLTNYYLEMTMGAFCFAPIQLDKTQEGGVPDGCLEVTVNIPHPGATGVPGLLSAQEIGRAHV